MSKKSCFSCKKHNTDVMCKGMTDTQIIHGEKRYGNDCMFFEPKEENVMSEKGTYDWHIECINCGNVRTHTLAKGQSIDGFRCKTICKYCGCYLNGGENPNEN